MEMMIKEVNLESEKSFGEVLDRMKYSLASNDEKDIPGYFPTPLQDLDPQDFA
ncbi:MAG: hypothetical protein LBB12_02655 [Holosporaceae bacterium]|jgi:hypothetical protein|nr:hypothetical protein [Holosporaceae bacterium]